MVYFDRILRSRFISGLSARIRVVSHRLAQNPLTARLIGHRKRLLGALLVLISICLGIWAHDLAQAEALTGWLKTHPPSPLIWKHALESRGYHALVGAKSLQRASKTLPSLVDEEGSAWASADLSWIALYQKQNDGQVSKLYCLDCAMPAMGWQPMGRGWEAFDPVLAAVDAATSLRKPTPRARAEWMDPREVRY